MNNHARRLSSPVELLVDQIVGNDGLSPLSHAAIYIDNALHNRPFITLESHRLKAYRVATHSLMRRSIMLISFIIFIMGFVEEATSSSPHCWVASFIQFPLICVILFESMLCYYYLGPRKFIASPWNMSRAIAAVIFAVDCVVTWVVAGSCGCGWEYLHLRPSRVIRSYLLIDCNRRIRAMVPIIMKTLRSVLPVGILLGIFICVWALVGIIIYADTTSVEYLHGSFENNADYFATFGNALYQLAVLLTTSNFPDVMVPYYSVSDINFFYFFVFIAIGIVFLLQLVTAVVYNVYKEELHDFVMACEKEKQLALIAAYEVLDPNGEGISLDVWRQLHAKIVKTCPTHQHEALFRMFADLDLLTMESFIEATDYMRMKLVLKKRRQLNPKFKLFFQLQTFLEKIATHRAFKIGIDVLLFSNAAIVVFVIAVEKARHAPATLAFVFFLDTMFIAELLVKVIVWWPSPFTKDTGAVNWGRSIDALIIVATSLGRWILEAFFGHSDRIALLLRTARLTRLLGRIKHFRLIFATFLHVFPSLAKFTVLLIALYSLFAVIGVAMFKDCIVAMPTIEDGLEYQQTPEWKDITSRFSNPMTIDLTSPAPCWQFPIQLSPLLLNDASAVQLTTVSCNFLNKEFVNTRAGREYADYGYWRNNFGSVSSAFVVLFEVMIVNNWQVIAHAYMELTHSTAFIYFFLFYLLATVTMMNIVVALILEAFLMRWKESNSLLSTSSDLEHLRKRYEALSNVISGSENYYIAKDRDSAEAFLRNIFWDDIVQLRQSIRAMSSRKTKKSVDDIEGDIELLECPMSTSTVEEPNNNNNNKVIQPSP